MAAAWANIWALPVAVGSLLVGVAGLRNDRAPIPEHSHIFAPRVQKEKQAGDFAAKQSTKSRRQAPPPVMSPREHAETLIPVQHLPTGTSALTNHGPDVPLWRRPG